MFCRRRIRPLHLHPQRERPAGHRFTPLAACAAVLLVLTGAAPLRAQLVAVVDAVAEDGGTNPDANKPVGFSVRKEDSKFIDALDDFARYVEKKTWDRAFRSITTLIESDPKGMVPLKDGFLVPARQRVWRSLTTMPPEGKQAYRLFNDAKARQLLAQVEGQDQDAAGGAGSTAPVDEIATLRKLFDQYFITSVGDQAADRLGDALYESGDFLGAATAWEAVLTDYPDTSLPKLRLQTKRAMALARSGQWGRFNAALKSIRETAPAQTVTIGGRPVIAADFLDSFAKSAAAAAATQPTAAGATPEARASASAAPSKFALPQSDDPLWHLRFFDESLKEKLQAALMNSGWYGNVNSLTSYVPPAATDGKRVYVNWLGIVFAADAKTGKLVWRTRKFGELADKFQNFLSYGVDISRYSITAAGDSVLVTGVNLDRLNYHQEPVRLVCLGGETGAIKWSSSTLNWTGVAGSGGGGNNQWSAAGPPLVVGRTVYVVGHPASGQEMTLLALALDTGALQWSVPLGSPQAGTNYRGQSTSPPPTLVSYGGYVFVLTNNGALLAIDTAARRMEWAFTYDMPGVIDPQMAMNFGYNMPPTRDAPGVAVVREGVLYLKEAGGREMYAVDLSGPALLWRRPLSPRETIARVTNDFLYLRGDDVGAIDLKDKALKWSAQLPAETEKARPVVTDAGLFVFLGRGVYQIDLKTGDTARIFRGHDRDSVGGVIFELPDRFVTVSNQGVTAYPLPEAQPGGAPAGQ